MGTKPIELTEITGEWDYGCLPKNVELGEGCFLERKHSLDRFRSTRQPGLKLGRNVRAYTWTQFNVEPSGVATPPIFSKGGSIPEPDEPRKKPTIDIGPNVWIGTRAVLLSGASIGEGAIIGAAAVVDFTVPPYFLVRLFRQFAEDDGAGDFLADRCSINDQPSCPHDSAQRASSRLALP